MLFSNVDYTPYLYQLKNNMLIIPTKCKQQKYKCDKYHIYILFNFKIMGEFKHEVRQFEKSYDNQQAEQISLM
ncbi:hypothetical protein K5F07_11535, partial [Acinetobacter baumannii]|uniref:hypothetical protein n=1 Tax=Acinetobacter baumannii TaxID=470 RepID=UPI001FF20298